MMLESTGRLNQRVHHYSGQSILRIYTESVRAAKVHYAKLFRNGSSQAVRLPKEFRFEGEKVRVRRVEGGVLLEPAQFDIQAWFANMDKYGRFDINREDLTPQERDYFDEPTA